LTTETEEYSPKFENHERKLSVTPDDILNEKIVLEGKLKREPGKLERHHWRKKSTMAVSNMLVNRRKTTAENLYLAEKMYKHLQQGDSYEQTRKSLSNVYGGFTQEGKYYHNTNLMHKRCST
jgi:hypothetical protein